MTPYKFSFPWPIAVFLFIIQVALLVLKVTALITIPWVLVLLPVLLYGGIGFIFIGLLMIKFVFDN